MGTVPVGFQPEPRRKSLKRSRGDSESEVAHTLASSTIVSASADAIARVSSAAVAAAASSYPVKSWALTSAGLSKGMRVLAFWSVENGFYEATVTRIRPHYVEVTYPREVGKKKSLVQRVEMENIEHLRGV